MFARLMVVIMVLAGNIYSPESLLAAELYKEQTLLAEPGIEAKPVGKAAMGEVQVLERRGYWVQLKAGEITGWIQLKHVKMDETMQWMAHVDVLRDTGRMGSQR